MILLSGELVERLALEPVVGERLDLWGRSFVVAAPSLNFDAWRLAESPLEYAWMEVVRVFRLGYYRALWAIHDAGFGYVEEAATIRVRDLWRRQPSHVRKPR